MSDDVGKLIDRGWEILSKLIYAVVVALAVFCWRVNTKVDNITNNKVAIAETKRIHDEDKSALWRKYSELETAVRDMGREVSENKVSIQFLSGRTP